jgi:hypothetical protein
MAFAANMDCVFGHCLNPRSTYFAAQYLQKF